MAGGIRDTGDDLEESHEINVTPFIDVMLVLLIIFMVAAPLSTVDVPVDLPPRDYTLLHYLLLRRGQVVTREEIESQLYDQSVEVMSNVVDAAVYSLRKKIDLPGLPSLIQTRRGMGYVLDDAQHLARSREKATQ